jgi:hypothetical protein
MSSIVSIIETAVLGLTPKPTFIHGFKSWANLKADEKKFPCVILVEPIRSTDTFRQGGLVDSSYPLFMLFLDRAELAYTPEQHRPIIDAMRDLRRQFILKLKESKNTYNEHIFKDITNVETTDTFNELDVNASGVFITFIATPLNSDSVCV